MTKLDRHDPNFARFGRSHPRRSGIEKTHDWIHICNSCGKSHWNGSPRPPRECPGLRFNGDPCGSTDIKTYNKLKLEAMPIGRVKVDLRSPSQMGRKGKSR